MKYILAKIIHIVAFMTIIIIANCSSDITKPTPETKRTFIGHYWNEFYTMEYGVRIRNITDLSFTESKLRVIRLSDSLTLNWDITAIEPDSILMELEGTNPSPRYRIERFDEDSLIFIGQYDTMKAVNYNKCHWRNN